MRTLQLHEASTVAKVPMTADATQLEDHLIQSAEYGQSDDARTILMVINIACHQ